MKKLALIALISTLATGAFAHSGVDTTTPANGAALTEVPAKVSFKFANGIRLTRAEMIHQDEPAVRLDPGDQTNFGRAFTLPLQEMGKGSIGLIGAGLARTAMPCRARSPFR